MNYFVDSGSFLSKNEGTAAEAIRSQPGHIFIPDSSPFNHFPFYQSRSLPTVSGGTKEGNHCAGNDFQERFYHSYGVWGVIL